MTSEPTRSIEVERKYDVSGSTGLPDLASLPGVARVSQPELRSLDAVYFDTADLVLARRAVALRRRTGGPDEGWHVKSSAPEGRHEWGWPLGDLSPDPLTQAVPIDVRSAVTPWCGDAELRPIARVRNQRHAILLQDAAGAVIGWTEVTVSAAATTATGLADTGVDTTPWLVGGTLMLLLGAVLMRRRRVSMES